MVVGNGLLANLFDDYKLDNRFLIFASGVSNSNEISPEAYEREKTLLKTYNNQKDKLVVYFSSCDVIYADTISKPYYFHKLEMENLVMNTFERYVIFRIPQVIGMSNNRFSLLNYFVNAIVDEKEIYVHKYAYKNLINVSDIKKMADYILLNLHKEKNIYNLINKNYYSIQYIIEEIELLLNKNAKVKLLPIGFKPAYKWCEEFTNLELKFTSDYLSNSIKQSYADINSNKIKRL